MWNPNTAQFLNDELVLYDRENNKYYAIDREDAPYNDTIPYYGGYNSTAGIYYAVNSSNQYV
jgi:hypothetical protein